MGKQIKTMYFDCEVIEKLEEIRAGRPFFYSGYVNGLLRERLGLPRKEKK